MTCRNCGQTIHATHDPNVPYVHDNSGNGYCDVTDAESAVWLAAFNPTGMRQEARPW